MRAWRTKSPGSASQDECDAVCVARALLIEHYEFPTEVAA